MKKMLFLVCSVLFISTLSSCGGGAGKAAKAAAGASVLIREASENVNFKGGKPSCTGHCWECGLESDGNYKCSNFVPKASSPSICDNCKHSIKRHAIN